MFIMLSFNFEMVQYDEPSRDSRDGSRTRFRVSKWLSVRLQTEWFWARVQWLTTV